VDDHRFDAIAKSVGFGRSRRDAVRVLGGGVLAVTLIRLMPIGAAAKKGKNKKKRKKRCVTRFNHCDLNGGHRCCAGRDHCCLDYTFRGVPTEGSPYCSGPGSQCCPASAGGGHCRTDELCCPLSQRYLGVNEYCESIGGECCDDEVGGSCGPGLECCIDASQSPEYTCCPKASASGIAAESRAPRNFRLRGGKHAR
jgi:hypothetical protein